MVQSFGVSPALPRADYFCAELRVCGELRGKLADQSGCGCGATRAEVIINVLDPIGLAMDNPK
jgi:hypothetical protein